MNWSKKFINHLLVNLNLKPIEISNALGITYTTLSLIRSNKVNSIKFDHLMNLLKYLKENNRTADYEKVLLFINELGNIPLVLTTDNNITNYMKALNK